MIVDSLNNAGAYRGLGSNIAKALDYLAANDFSTIEPGRYEIDGDTVYAMVQRYDTKPRDKGVWEAHHRYIDVQYIAAGIEVMGYANIAGLKESQAYDAEKDYLLLTGAGDFVTTARGTFIVFFPQDAHMPCLAYEAPAPVLKVVVKVQVSQWTHGSAS